MSQKAYEFISLYEFGSIYTLISIFACTGNLYILSIISILFLSAILQMVLKEAFKNTQFGKRPEQAHNCNMINSGGDAKGKPGFPSGHNTIAFLLATIFLVEYLKVNKTVELYSPLIILTILFAILMPLSRIKLGCHTYSQVIGGGLLGIVLGLLFTLVFDPFLSKKEKYVTDKSNFFTNVFIKK